MSKNIEVEVDEKELKDMIAGQVKEVMDESKTAEQKELEKKELEKKELENKGKTFSEDQVKKMIDTVLEKTIKEKKMQFPGIIKEKGEGDRNFAEVLKAIRYRDQYLLKKYDMSFVKDEKIMVEGVNAGGGFLVPPEFAQQIIDESLTYEVIRGLCTAVPMTGFVKNWPVLLSGSSAYWIDENGKKTESTPVWGQLTLTAYKLCSLVKVTDEELEDSNPSASQFLIKNFAEVIGNEEDRAMLVGTGGAGDPITGLLNQAGVNIVPSGVLLTFDDIIDAMTLALQNGAKDLAFLINPRDIGTLMTLKDANGQYLWGNPTTSTPATIYGRPVYLDGNIPTNLGAGLNQSVMFVGEFKKTFVANKGGIIISNGLDGEDFSYDRSSFRAVKRTGLAIAAPARPKISVITGINP